MHWDFILILAVLGVLVPWRSSARIRELLSIPELQGSQRIALYASTIALQWLAAGIVFWRMRAHGFSFAELGIALPSVPRAVITAAAISFFLVLNQVYGVRKIAALPPEKRGLLARVAEKLLPRTGAEIAVGLVLVLTVAICEEFVYRGFIQGLFAQKTHSMVAGAFISAVFFGTAHIYQQAKGVVTTFIAGLIFSAALIFSGSLLSCIIIHFCVDLSAGIAASRQLLTMSESADGGLNQQ